MCIKFAESGTVLGTVETLVNKTELPSLKKKNKTKLAFNNSTF